MIRRRTLLLATPAIITAAHVRAAETVKIGVLYPLTGNSAASGQEAKQSIEVGAEIVNTGHPELKAMPIGTTAGLPKLGGARIEPIYVDHRGDPSVAQSLAQRLITNDKVVALLGSYQSSTAMTATAVAERYGVPFVVSDSVAGNITTRGFKYTFRVTPIAQNFAESYMRFLTSMKQSGKPIDNIAIVNENTDYGSSVGDAIEAEAKKSGFPLAIRIPYSANGADVTAQVLQLKQKNPSVALFVSYASDAISVWSEGPAGTLSYEINKLYQAKSGREIDDVSGRDMQAFFVLADAINRAGAADPKQIQAALAATDWPESAVFIGYRGVKFDSTGQNVLGATYLTQLQGKDYATVWPEAPGNAKLTWPMTGWKT
jgi:branched-chain amino acid transport system substrate-binding protein